MQSVDDSRRVESRSAVLAGESAQANVVAVERCPLCDGEVGESDPRPEWTLVEVLKVRELTPGNRLQPSKTFGHLVGSFAEQQRCRFLGLSQRELVRVEVPGHGTCRLKHERVAGSQ